MSPGLPFPSILTSPCHPSILPPLVVPVVCAPQPLSSSRPWPWLSFERSSHTGHQLAQVGERLAGATRMNWTASCMCGRFTRFAMMYCSSKATVSVRAPTNSAHKPTISLSASQRCRLQLLPLWSSRTQRAMSVSTYAGGLLLVASKFSFVSFIKIQFRQFRQNSVSSVRSVVQLASLSVDSVRWLASFARRT